MILIDQRIILGSIAILFVLVIMFMYFGHSNLKSIGKKQLTADNTLKRLAETVLAMKHDKEELCSIASTEEQSVSEPELVVINDPDYVDSDNDTEPVVIVTPVKPVKQQKRKSKKIVEPIDEDEEEIAVVSD